MKEETLVKEQVEKAESRLEAFGVASLNAKGKVYNRTYGFKTGNGKVEVARMKTGKLDKIQLMRYREMAKKAMAEAKAANPWYGINFK